MLNYTQHLEYYSQLFLDFRNFFLNLTIKSFWEGCSSPLSSPLDTPLNSVIYTVFNSSLQWISSKKARKLRVNKTRIAYMTLIGNLIGSLCINCPLYQIYVNLY